MRRHQLLWMCVAVLCASESTYSSASVPTKTVRANMNSKEKSDCKSRFTALVTELTDILASDPESISPVYEAFHHHFPIEGCRIDDILAIARSSRFFAGSDEQPEYYNISFNSAGVSSRPGFSVQISLSKKTGNLELPFAKVNGY